MSEVAEQQEDSNLTQLAGKFLENLLGLGSNDTRLSCNGSVESVAII